MTSIRGAAILVAFLPSALLAQNEAVSTPIGLESRLPVPVDSARAALAATRSDAIQAVILTVSGINAKTKLVADGQSTVSVTVRVFDVNGGALQGRHVARISIDGATLKRLDDGAECRIEETGRRCADEEILIVDGEGAFGVRAPTSSREVFVAARVGGHSGKVKLAFAAELRPLVAAGLVEMMLSFNSSSSGGGGSSLSDAFERDLRRWETRFSNGKGSFAGRSSFFLKGTTTSGYLVSAMFDSEKDLRTREFSDFNPDRYYPVMGDSGQRGYEAQSSDRLYVRIDKGRGSLLYGDFATSANFSMAADGARLAPISIVDLGQYNRSMTGLRWHQEAEAGFVDVWATRDSLRQAVEEYRGNGTSGPYAISNYSALENSEKLEVVVRDRNNTSRVLSVKALERYADYNFEPFSGRVVLKAPLPSLDAELNPVSLRITYEVDTGGEQFWTYGLSAQRRLTPWLQAGLVYVSDDNPGRPAGSGFATTPGNGFADLRELRSVNLSINTGYLGQMLIEVAQADSVTALADLSGSAWRVDWRLGRGEADAEQGRRWNLRLFGGEAERDFVNASSTLAPGRTELAVEGAAELGPLARVALQASQTEDAATGGQRTGASLQLERDVTDRVSLELGIRHFSQRRGGVWSLSPMSSSVVTPGQGPAYGGAGLNPNGAGFWGMGVGLNPFTGQPQTVFNGSQILTAVNAPDVDVTSYSLGIKTRINEFWTVGVETGQDNGFANDPVWGALTSDYRTENARAFARLESPTGRAAAGLEYAVSEGTSVYGRWEETTGMGSVYSLENAIEGRAVAIGVRRSVDEQSAGFSEMRMREGMNQQDLESVTGIQRGFVISDRIEATVLAERLEILSGNSRSATALGGGVSFGDPLWQGDTRLELRRLDADPSAASDNTADSVMSSVSFARKVSGNWTGLVRNYLLFTDEHSRAGSQLQNRFQVGAAYRPIGTNTFDMLLRYENKIERNAELASDETRRVNILSASWNLHPSRRLWVSGRVAAKDVTETLVDVEDDYRAWLFASRVIFDVGPRLDVSAMAGVMTSSADGARDEAFGIEVGYLVKENLWLSLGHNFVGFYDRDLSGSDPTQSGWYVRMRMKFDEKLLKSSEP